ncbi:hypothetical protein D9M68_837270 [compost metagenome]
MTALDPGILGNSTVSLYGPEPDTTLATTGPQIPAFNAVAKAPKLLKFVPAVGAALLIV